MRSAALLAALALIGCADHPKRPECETEYAHTIAHCPPKRPRPAQTVEECQRAGGVSIIERGEFKGCASREAVQDALRRINGGRY